MIKWSGIENFFGTLYLNESHGLQTFVKAAIHRRVHWAYRGFQISSEKLNYGWSTTQTTVWDNYFKRWFEEIPSALHLENFRKVRNNFKETTGARKNSSTTFSYEGNIPKNTIILAKRCTEVIEQWTFAEYNSQWLDHKGVRVCKCLNVVTIYREDIRNSSAFKKLLKVQSLHMLA